jgi:hypothetical protein
MVVAAVLVMVLLVLTCSLASMASPICSSHVGLGQSWPFLMQVNAVANGACMVQQMF